MTLVTPPLTPLHLPQRPGQTRAHAVAASFTRPSSWWKRRRKARLGQEQEGRARKELLEEVTSPGAWAAAAGALVLWWMDGWVGVWMDEWLSDCLPDCLTI